MDATTLNAMTGDEQTAQAMRFLSFVFDPQDWIEVRRLPSRRSTWFQLADVAATQAALQAAWQHNARQDNPDNVYVGINPRDGHGRNGDECVPLARALFADFDKGATVDDALARIRDAGLPEPSIVIVSGGGVHAYWLLIEPITDMAVWAATMKGIIAAVRSDKSIHNPERIMRLPGTRNVKPDRPGRPWCHIVSINDTRHPAAAFPVAQPRHPTAAKASKAKAGTPPASMMQLCDEGYVFMATGQVEGERRPALYRIACDMWARDWPRDTIQREIMQRVSSIRPALTDDDIADIPRQIDNACSAAREPGHVSSPAIRSSKVAALTVAAGDQHDGAADLARPQTLNDVGAARRLAKMIRGQLAYVRERRDWIRWDGRRWADHAEHVAVQYAKRMHDDLWRDLGTMTGERPPAVVKFVQESGTHARVSAAVVLARSEDGINTSQADYDSHPWLLNVRNGVIDLRSGELLAHDPSHYITQLAAVEYVPDAKSELWERFIDSVTCGDQDIGEFLQQACGLALTGDVSDEVLITHSGEGCNGKSTFLEAVAAMLGDYAAVAPPGLFASRSFDAHPTEIATLHGKRFVTAIEQEANRSLRESLVKSLTGGDTIRTRRMREDFWEMKPTWHIHIAYNAAPRLSGTDDGIRRRLCVVPWRASFKGSPDLTVKQRLVGEGERSGILNWAIEGLRRRLAAGRLFVPEAVRMSTDDYIADEDVIGRFLADRTEPDSAGVVEVRTLLSAFRAWMEADGSPRYVIDRYTATTLGRELARRGFRKMRPDSGTYRKQTVIAGLRTVDTHDDVPPGDEEWATFAR
jgi:P4 family phage/plasmid primase-like protien